MVTIQTFPYALEAILTNQSLAQSNFAVIIDEAHTSQTGSTAKGLRAALTLNLSPQELEQMSIEDILTKVQEARVMPKNVSHFAFTATPKHSTKMLFGRPKDPSQPVSDENKPESFHLYTQRQAIDEGFILDVLENYTHYDTAYKIGENILDEKRVDSKQAAVHWLAGCHCTQPRSAKKSNLLLSTSRPISPTYWKVKPKPW